MNHKGFLHSILMMACCILPVVLFVIFAPQLKAASPNFNYSWLFILLCPLMHFFMMKGHSKEDCEKHDKKPD
ncbi:MAG: DUF2933 domain-containing protein [Peptococcaceae bacterium]|nr:DUF2933 domain-containing protein [Peptococcaceae bacterium]